MTAATAAALAREVEDYTRHIMAWHELAAKLDRFTPDPRPDADLVSVEGGAVTVSTEWLSFMLEFAAMRGEEGAP